MRILIKFDVTDGQDLRERLIALGHEVVDDYGDVTVIVLCGCCSLLHLRSILNENAGKIDFSKPVVFVRDVHALEPHKPVWAILGALDHNCPDNQLEAALQEAVQLKVEKR